MKKRYWCSCKYAWSHKKCFADVPGSNPGILRPAHFFFVKKDKWRMADHDMIVEQDAADIGAKSYIWKYCLIIVVMDKGAIQELTAQGLCRLCDRKFTEMSTTRAVADTLVYVGRY